MHTSPDDDLIPIGPVGGSRLERAAVALRYRVRPLRQRWLHWRAQWASFWQVW